MPFPSVTNAPMSTHQVDSIAPVDLAQSRLVGFVMKLFFFTITLSLLAGPLQAQNPSPVPPGFDVLLEVGTVQYFPSNGGGIINIMMASNVSVAGFQFNLIFSPDMVITNASDGLAGDAGFSLDHTDSMVLGFSMTGATISPQPALETLVVVGFSCTNCPLTPPEICIVDPIFADSNANNLPTAVGPCFPPPPPPPVDSPVPPSVDNALMTAQFTMTDGSNSSNSQTVTFRGVISINRGEAVTNSSGEIAYPMEVIGAELSNSFFDMQLSIKTSPEAPWMAVPQPTNNPPIYLVDMLLRNGNGAVLGSASGVPLTPSSNFPQGNDLLVPVVDWHLDLADTVILDDPNGSSIILEPNPDVPEVSIIQNPSFSVGPGSSPVQGPSVIYGMGAPPTPGLTVLGVLPFEDDVDAFCHGVSVTDPGRNIYFSVDRSSFGAPGSAVNLAATAFPPTASSSEFGSTGVTTGAPPHNTLVLPHSSFVLNPADDLDALDNFAPNFSDFDGNGEPDRPAWYSLSEPSATVGSPRPETPRAGLPPDGILTADDIAVFIPSGAVPGGPNIYASGRVDIGLFDGSGPNGLTDDIDAVVMMPLISWDSGNPPQITPAPKNETPLNAQGEINIPAGGLSWDLAFFSLSRDSASLGGPLGYTAADVFVTNFNGTFMRLHQAADLDLTGEDNINAMKFMLTSWHGSVEKTGNNTTGSNVGVLFGNDLVRVDVPAVSTGSGFVIAQAIADGLNDSSYFQARPWMRAIAREYNSGLLSIIGSGPCNTVFLPSNPNIVITPMPLPLPFPLFPPGGVCPGDECDDPIPAVDGFNGFDTTDCTDSPDPYDDAQCLGTSLGEMNQDIWFTYTPEVCGVLKASTCSTSSFDTDLVGYHAISCSEKIQIACNGDALGCANFTSEMQFPVTAGNKYLIRLGGWDANAFGNGEMRLELVPDSTIGDECVDAISASLGANWLDTSCATDSLDAYGDAQCANTALGAMVQDVWYVYTPDLDGLLNVRTCDRIDFDSDLVIYKGNCTDLEQIACNGDGVDPATGAACAGFSSAVEDVPIFAGEPIYIRVGGWEDGQSGKGLLDLEYRQATTPPAIEQLTCSSDCADTATITWVNGGAYDSITVLVNGTVVATLGGADTSYTATGITGTRTICLEPVAGGMVGPQVCCEVFGLTPPPENVNCDPSAATTDVVIAWNNPVAYNAVEVWVNGVMEATLPGTDTNFVVVGGAGREICVRGLLANCWSDLKCCDDTGTPPPPEVQELICESDCADTASITWVNGGAYDSITVLVNGAAVATLGGADTSYTATGITGTRIICLEPVAGGLVGPQVCCEVFGLTPPPENVSCDPIFGTTNVAVAWNNPVSYDAIEVWVNGVMETTLPGTATNFLVALGAGREICVRGLVANCWSELKCCDNTGTPPGVGDLNCDPILGTTDVAVAWSNPIVYDSIEVTLNGTLVQTLSGTDTFTTVTGVVGTREICVIGIIGGVATDSACCTVSTGGPGNPPVTAGDPNGDGAIDIGDAVNMLGYLFSQEAINCLAAMDVNGDGTTDISDPIYVLAYLFTGGQTPVGGGPCSPDSSSLGCDDGGCP